jgi:hypothetical protein
MELAKNPLLHNKKRPWVHLIPQYALASDTTFLITHLFMLYRISKYCSYILWVYKRDHLNSFKWRSLQIVQRLFAICSIDNCSYSFIGWWQISGSVDWINHPTLCLTSLNCSAALKAGAGLTYRDPYLLWNCHTSNSVRTPKRTRFLVRWHHLQMKSNGIQITDGNVEWRRERLSVWQRFDKKHCDSTVIFRLGIESGSIMVYWELPVLIFGCISDTTCIARL